MKTHVWFAYALLIAAAAPLIAQPPVAVPTTAVMVRLTVKRDVDRPKLMKVMPEEVRATVRLYLDGKIQQWYSQSSGMGVVFIMNSTSVAEAKALINGLPLAKAGLADFEFTALGPLGPLRLLMGDPSKQ
uniref:Muconolactone isomerase domain-containing protein n=1 Tax=Solibacter usitatus (strain Ellin6076) TaxID=234267 RepID=Q029B4_SOLUE